MAFDEFFDWKNPKISNWKKVLRIQFRHEIHEVMLRGLTAQEGARILLTRFKKRLDKDEIEFLEGLMK